MQHKEAGLVLNTIGAVLKSANIFFSSEGIRAESKNFALHQPLGSFKKHLQMACDGGAIAVSALMDSLFPERCRVCGNWMANQTTRPSKVVCAVCWRLIYSQSPIVDWCYLADGRALKVISAGRYDGALKRLVYKLKYDGDRLIASDLSRLIIEAFSLLADELRGRPLVMVPVPLHNQRLKSRGFNQAELIAQQAAYGLQVRLSSRALKRLRDTKPQHGLNRSQRQVNLSEAFLGYSAKLAGKAVILVDDIYTSGATLSAAANEVLSKGACAVYALTVARALWTGDDSIASH